MDDVKLFQRLFRQAGSLTVTEGDRLNTWVIRESSVLDPLELEGSLKLLGWFLRLAMSMGTEVIKVTVGEDSDSWVVRVVDESRFLRASRKSVGCG